MYCEDFFEAHQVFSLSLILHRLVVAGAQLPLLLAFLFLYPVKVVLISLCPRMLSLEMVVGVCSWVLEVEAKFDSSPLLGISPIFSPTISIPTSMKSKLKRLNTSISCPSISSIHFFCFFSNVETWIGSLREDGDVNVELLLLSSSILHAEQVLWLKRTYSIFSPSSSSASASGIVSSTCGGGVVFFFNFLLLVILLSGF